MPITPVPIVPRITRFIPAGPKYGTSPSSSYITPTIKNLTYYVYKDPLTNKVTYQEDLTPPGQSKKKYGPVVEAVDLSVTCLGEIKNLAVQQGSDGTMAAKLMNSEVFGMGSEQSWVPNQQLVDAIKAKNKFVEGNVNRTPGANSPVHPGPTVINVVTREPNGKYLIGGDFLVNSPFFYYESSEYNMPCPWKYFDDFERDYVFEYNVPANLMLSFRNLARLNPDLTVDTTFAPKGAIINRIGSALCDAYDKGIPSYTRKIAILLGPNGAVEKIQRIQPTPINEPKYVIRGSFSHYSDGTTPGNYRPNFLVIQNIRRPEFGRGNLPLIAITEEFQDIYPENQDLYVKPPGGFPGLRIMPCLSKVTSGNNYCEQVADTDIDLLKTLNTSVYWEKTTNLTGGQPPRIISSIKPGCREWDGFKSLTPLQLLDGSPLQETYKLKFSGNNGDLLGKTWWSAADGDTVTFITPRFATRIVFDDQALNDYSNYDTQVERDIDIYKITAAQSASNNTVVGGVAKWRSLGELNNSTLNFGCKLQLSYFDTKQKKYIWKDVPSTDLSIVGNNGYEISLGGANSWSYDLLDGASTPNPLQYVTISFKGSQFLLPSNNSIKINLIRHTKLPTRIKFNKIENYYMGDVDRASSLTNSTTSGLRDLLGDGKIDLSVTLETRSLLGQNWVTIDKSANIRVYATQNPSVQLPKTSSVDMKTQVDPNNKLISHKKLTFKAEFTPSGADVSIYDQCYTDDKFTWNRIEAGDGSRFYKKSAHGDVTPVSIMKVNNYQTLEITSCNTKGWSIELNKIQPVFVKPRTLFPNLISLTGKLNEFKPSNTGIVPSKGIYSIGKLNYEGSENSKGGFFRGRFEKSLLTTLSANVSSQYLQITQKCTKCAFKIQMPGNVPLLVDAPKAKPPTVASSLGFDESYSLKCLIDEEPIIRQINVTPAGQIHPKITAKEIPIEVRVWIDKNKNVIKN